MAAPHVKGWSWPRDGVSSADFLSQTAHRAGQTGYVATRARRDGSYLFWTSRGYKYPALPACNTKSFGLPSITAGHHRPPSAAVPEPVLPIRTGKNRRMDGQQSAGNTCAASIHPGAKCAHGTFYSCSRRVSQLSPHPQLWG